jgi:hypothetical protein
LIFLGDFIRAFKEMEASQTRMFLEQEEKKRKEEEKLENERTKMDRSFQMEMGMRQAMHCSQPSGDDNDTLGIKQAIHCLNNDDFTYLCSKTARCLSTVNISHFDLLSWLLLFVVKD